MKTRRLTIKELPPSERPRERALVSGITTLSDAELLAILLRVERHRKRLYSWPKSTVKGRGLDRAAAQQSGRAAVGQRLGAGQAHLLCWQLQSWQ